jgi:hypothetical protein
VSSLRGRLRPLLDGVRSKTRAGLVGAITSTRTSRRERLQGFHHHHVGLAALWAQERVGAEDPAECVGPRLLLWCRVAALVQ